MKLPVPMTPYQDESLAGYVWRLATLNGYENPQHMRRVLKCKASLYVGRRVMREALPKVANSLAMLTGYSTKLFMTTFSPQCPTRTKKNLVAGAAIDDWRYGSPKICPACLTEHGYAQTAWGHLGYLVCTEHNTRLLTACPHCNQPIQWHADIANQCPYCNQEWQVETTEVPAYQPCINPASGQADSEWQHQYGWGLIKVACPFDAQHHRIPYWPDDSGDIQEHFEKAHALVQDESTDWQQIRSIGFAHLSALSLQALDAVLGMPKNFDKWSTRPTDAFRPQWLQEAFDSETCRFLVDADLALRALSVERQTIRQLSHQKAPTSYHHASDSLNELGLPPIDKSVQLRHYRYDLRQLNAWAEAIPEHPAREVQGHRVYSSDPRFRLACTSYCKFLKDVQAGYLTAQRPAGGGLKYVIIKESTFEQWCRDQRQQFYLSNPSIHGFAVELWLGLPLRAVHALLKQNIITIVKRPSGRGAPAIDSKSVSKFVERNYKALLR